MSRQRDLISVSQGAAGDPLFVDAANNRVGIGTSSPAQKLVTYAASGNLEILNTVRNDNPVAGVAAIGFNVAHSSEGDFTQAGIGLVRGIANGGGALAFYNKSDGATGNFTTANERMRIDNGGRVFVNTTSLIGADGGYLHVDALNNLAFQFNRNSNDDIGRFYRSGTKVGSISVTASTTAYNTSSDYRLKENVVPLAGAADRLAQIPVCRFNFIADPDKTVDGFLAHEVQAFVPECVTGLKDQVETVEVTDEDGNVTTETRPVYQGIDQSKLVPLLTAALQEALQKIDALETRISALETN